MGDIRGKITLPFAYWPNPINQSTGVSHPINRNLRSNTSEKWEIVYKYKTLIEPIQSSGTPYTICGKGYGPPCSLIEHLDSNKSGLPGHNPKWAGTGNPLNDTHWLLVFGACSVELI